MEINNFQSTTKSFNGQTSTSFNNPTNNSGEQRMVSFQEAIVMGFNKYCCFTGRSSRSEYWFWTLFTFLVGIAANILDAISGISLFSALCSLGLLLPNLGIFWRRMHDIGRTGAWWCLSLIPIVLLFITAVKIAVYSAQTHYYYHSLDSAVYEASSLIIISLVAFIAIGVWLIVWCATPSQNFTNKYGEVPNME